MCTTNTVRNTVRDIPACVRKNRITRRFHGFDRTRPLTRQGLNNAHVYIARIFPPSLPPAPYRIPESDGQ